MIDSEPPCEKGMGASEWGSVLILSQEVLWQRQKDPAPDGGGEFSSISSQGLGSICLLKDVKFLSFHKRMQFF